ncbi:MAG: hypothetical protein MUF18_18360, partial [Fimbriiglobus sp.]|nr:hypothetical protein [Fimbriiglobus sp.]
MFRRKWLLLAAVAVVAPAARADVKVHPIFSDNMVIQRDMDTVVWGTAEAGEKVTAELSDGKAAVAKGEATADDKGHWSVTLPKGAKPGTGFDLKVKGKNEVAFKNVAVGDVWLCSGQSNMEWKLSQLPKDDQGKKAAAKAANPNIRLFTVPNKPAYEPQAAFATTATEGLWLPCEEKTAFNFSAVGYFFGRDIQATQNVPVGLISSDWGGTICEAWASKGSLDAVPEFKYFHENLEKAIKSFDPKKAEEDFKKATEKYEADLAKWKEAADKAKAEGKPAPMQPRKPTK